MSIKIVSYLSDMPSSSSTCNEIVPIEDTSRTFSSNNPTQITMSHNLNNNNEPKSNQGNSNGNGNEPRSNDGDNNRRSIKAEMLSKLIGANLNSLDKASKRIRKCEDQIKSVSDRFKELELCGSEEELGELKKTVMKLKQQIFSKKHEDEKPEESDVPHRPGSNDTAKIDGANNDETLKNPAFERTFFEKFWACYDELDLVSIFCLLCFSVFPEDAEIKKRVIIYWWIGEGFVTTEQLANELFNKFIAMGFIMCKKGSLGVNICKMDPLVRCYVIEIAKRSNFIDFDNDYYANARACLTGTGLTEIQDLENLNTLFNVNEDILEFKPEYFSKMKKLRVLYLGRWQTSVSHHIEVADTKSMKKNANVLDGLENITNLRFLSLHGISRITELPESISKLTCLTILDMRACHNLEVIPDGIGLLKNLTHLDMSECYLLDHMPKGLASLSKLQVLRGFLVSESKNSCTLDDLRKFPKLRKLSLYAVVSDFPSDRDLRALNQFNALTNLTIAWARGSIQAKPAEVLQLGLIKLDLQCFPGATWLRACNLKNLKELYVRGGKFSNLTQFDNKDAKKDEWEVEVLRLKYLNDLEMDWSDLQELFPKLKSLEIVNCPKPTSFPIDYSQESMMDSYIDGIHISISYNDVSCF